MNFNEYVSEVSSRLAIRKLFVVSLMSSLVTNLILATAIATTQANEKIVVIPAEPTKSFWLDNHSVSTDYLEQMGVFVLQLALNNSPETLDYNLKKLLKYVAPEQRGHTELALLEQARKIRLNNSSTAFLPQKVEVKTQSQVVAVSGTYKQFIGNALASQSEKCFLIDFSYQGSRLWVKTLNQANCKKPFEKLSTEENGGLS